MIAIVNVTKNWGIGFENALLVHLSADLQVFRQMTLGKTVIYGRKTLETFPNQKPLKGRRNLILSKNPNFSAEGAEVFSDTEQLLAAVKDLPSEEVFVIGGAEVYRELLPYCTAACVTKTDIDVPADRFFPNLDALPNWRIEKASLPLEENGVEFRYIYYVNQEK